MNTNALISNGTVKLSEEQKQWALILIAFLMTALSTYVLKDIGDFRTQVRIIKSFIIALILNAGLWASILKPSGVWRYPIALYLIPESIGAGFVLSYWHWTIGVLGIIFHLALAFKILKPKRSL